MAKRKKRSKAASSRERMLGYSVKKKKRIKSNKDMRKGKAYNFPRKTWVSRTMVAAVGSQAT